MLSLDAAAAGAGGGRMILGAAGVMGHSTSVVSYHASNKERQR
jgi:hypothetical protein